MNLKAICLVGFAIAALPMLSLAKSTSVLKSPEKNVLCDKYVCFSAKDGVSTELTKKYLGDKRAKAIELDGHFDRTAVTFANGIFCDINEQKCHIDRYFDAGGKRSAISKEYTHKLFEK
ncbi:TPA: YcgJ family protein [Providencia alcalifaciens]